MAKLLVILFIALTFETCGVILLSKGLKALEGPKSFAISELAQLVGRALSDPRILLGILFEAVFFVCLLVMMSNADVSFVWPLTSLTFVFATLAAKFYLHEQIDALRWTGVLLIVLGAGLITYTEKKRERIERGVAVIRSAEYPRL